MNSNGYLDEFEDREVETDRHSYKKAYFFDQGVWAIKSEFIFERTGPSPWFWLGPRVKSITREWITGRDINGAFDVCHFMSYGINLRLHQVNSNTNEIFWKSSRFISSI